MSVHLGYRANIRATRAGEKKGERRKRKSDGNMYSFTNETLSFVSVDTLFKNLDTV